MNDEFGITSPQIWYKDGLYHMIYSYRSIQEGYRMGYAISEDGICWRREDSKMGIEVSLDGWDSEMVCYGKMVVCENKTYLFYCGNHYGRDGIGYAYLSDSFCSL